VIKTVRIDSTNELDAALTSLETTMKMLVVGGGNELNVAMTRYLHVYVCIYVCIYLYVYICYIRTHT
jgi:hypothetical protein